MAFANARGAGVDKGKGGKYLILPPDYKGKAPAGYIVLPSMTYQGYALLRSILQSGSDADVAKAVAYARRIELYPLSQAAKPPATTFVDAIDVVYDSTIPYDLRFFQSLDRIVQIEPWLSRPHIFERGLGAGWELRTSSSAAHPTQSIEQQRPYRRRLRVDL